MTKKAQREQEYERYMSSQRTLISYGDHQTMTAELREKLADAQSRVKELEKICTIDGIEDLIKTRDDLTADNARLRELLKRIANLTGTNIVGAIPQDLFDRIKAAIERPHDAT